jgi:hypothetical protein
MTDLSSTQNVKNIKYVGGIRKPSINSTIKQTSNKDGFMRTVTKPLTSSQLGNYPHTAENSSRKTTNTNSHYIRDPNGVVRKSVVTTLDSQRRTIG